jgi:hypothetical protein
MSKGAAMIGIERWIFSDAVLCEDGRYKVIGRSQNARNYDGSLSETGLGFDMSSAGMLVGPATGYGDTPQSARDAAAYDAGVQDGKNREVVHRAQYQIMGGYR